MQRKDKTMDKRRFNSGFECPIIWCPLADAHEHKVCPGCGALEYGNVFCTACKKYWQELGAEDVVVHFDKIQSLFERVVREVIRIQQRDVQDNRRK